MSLKGQTIFITGASRGIGAAFAKKFGADGANVVIIGKTLEPHPKLQGTILEVAETVKEVGGNPLPLQVDVRDEEQVRKAIEKTVDTFGGIDILINNASAIYPTPTPQTPMKRFDLMMDCNVRATFLCSQLCYPYLIKSANPHILNISPPLNILPKWFKNHVAYSISKYGMSMCTLGMAAEFAKDGIAVNSLWPKTLIATSAISTFFPMAYDHSRKPEIMADAAYAIVTKDAKILTGQFFVDEELLRSEGIVSFEHYALHPENSLQPDLFI